MGGGLLKFYKKKIPGLKILYSRVKWNPCYKASKGRSGASFERVLYKKCFITDSQMPTDTQ